MFDFGWLELLVIFVIAIFAIGPKELPYVMRNIGRFVQRLNGMKYALSRQFDDFMNEEEEKGAAHKPIHDDERIILDEEAADMDDDYITPKDDDKQDGER